MKSLTQLIAIPKTEFSKLSYCYHYHKPVKVVAPYAVWQEQDEASFNADNSKGERALEGIIDFYTKTEGDTKLDEIENALIAMGAAWQLTSVLFEEESNLIHFSWDWSVS